MKTRYKTICATAIFATISGAAFAEEMNSETCASALSPSAKAIFEAVAPKVEADSELKKLIKKTLRPMVMSGELKRKVAKENAPKAGECLRLLKMEKQG